MLKTITTIAVVASLTCGFATADSFEDKVKSAMASEHRSDQEKQRDHNRLPVHTLKFFGIKEDMRVLELIPGRGWYTKLLAPALQEKGKLYVGVATKRIEDKLANDKMFSDVTKVATKSQLQYNKDEGLYDLLNPELEIDNLDAVLTFRNYHNLTYKGRTTLNKSVFDALKPGGIYGVIDHTRRHMEQDNGENRRRIDPVLAIKEILDAGFEFVDYSSLHYRADDELRYEVGRKTVTGNTDRFTFLFKKPLK